MARRLPPLSISLKRLCRDLASKGFTISHQGDSIYVSHEDCTLSCHVFSLGVRCRECGKRHGVQISPEDLRFFHISNVI